MPKLGLLRKYIDPETTISSLLAGIPSKRENRIQVVRYLAERIGSMESSDRIYLQTLLKRKLFYPEKFLRKAIPEYILTYLENYVPNTASIIRPWRKDSDKKENQEERLIVELVSDCVKILAKDADFLNHLQESKAKILRTLCRLIYEVSDIVTFRKEVLKQEPVSSERQSDIHMENSIRTVLELYRILKGREDRFYSVCDELLSLIENCKGQ